MATVPVTETVWQAWVDYVGLKRHFQEETFIWKPGWSSKTLTVEALRARNDLAKFAEFVRKVKPREERIQYLISTFLNNNHAWIGDVVSDDAKERHRARKKRIGSLHLAFPRECQAIADYANKEKKSLAWLLTKQCPPPIIKASRNIVGGVSDETLAILDRVFKFAGVVDCPDPLWQNRSLVLRKYSALLVVEKSVIKQGMENLAAITPRGSEDRITSTEEKQKCRLPI